MHACVLFVLLQSSQWFGPNLFHKDAARHKNIFFYWPFIIQSKPTRWFPRLSYWMFFCLEYHGHSDMSCSTWTRTLKPEFTWLISPVYSPFLVNLFYSTIMRRYKVVLKFSLLFFPSHICYTNNVPISNITRRPLGVNSGYWFL